MRVSPSPPSLPTKTISQIGNNAFLLLLPKPGGGDGSEERKIGWGLGGWRRNHHKNNGKKEKG